MTGRRISRALGTATALSGFAALIGMVAAPVAQADPVLDPIINTVNRDRGNTDCPALSYSGALEVVAQKYARSELLVDSVAYGYNGKTSPHLGSGDPQAAAINSAYRNGAGREISQCRYTEFGVGFIRHEDRSVDVVTIVFGEPATPIPTPIPTPTATPSPVKTARITADVDVYGEPGGVGTPGRVVAKDTIVIVKQRRDDNWVELVDIGWVWGDFVSGG